MESLTDPLGNRVTQVWNAFGQPDAFVDALGNRRTFLYDLVGNKIAEVDPLGNRWSFGFDQMGRQTLPPADVGEVTRWRDQSWQRASGAERSSVVPTYCTCAQGPPCWRER